MTMVVRVCPRRRRDRVGVIKSDEAFIVWTVEG
jgi:hypothetical protein